MALTDYSGLCSTLADYLNRDDLTSIIPTFVTLFETRAGRDLRVRQMETQATLTTVAGTAAVALPDDYLEGRGLVLQGAPLADLGYLTPAAMAATYASGTTGRPAKYTVIGSNVQFGPTPDAAYDALLTYYAAIPALSDTTTTNWLLTSSPDLYLYGSLLEAAPYLNDDARIDVWGKLYDAAIGRTQAADERARWPGSPLSIKASVSW